jgi:hypothetical protein
VCLDILRWLLRQNGAGSVCHTQSEDLLFALNSFVMADALLAGNSALSYAACWLSKGWLWAFQSDQHAVPTAMTEIHWNEKGEVHIPKIHPPRWPRQAPGSSTRARPKRSKLNSKSLSGRRIMI